MAILQPRQPTLRKMAVKKSWEHRDYYKSDKGLSASLSSRTRNCPMTSTRELFKASNADSGNACKASGSMPSAGPGALVNNFEASAVTRNPTRRWSSLLRSLIIRLRPTSFSTSWLPVDWCMERRSASSEIPISGVLATSCNIHNCDPVTPQVCSISRNCWRTEP